MEEGGGGWGRRVGEGDWLCTWSWKWGRRERERLLWSRIDGHQKSITDLNRIDGLLGWRAKGGGNEDAPRGGDEAGGREGRGIIDNQKKPYAFQKQRQRKKDCISHMKTFIGTEALPG